MDFDKLTDRNVAQLDYAADNLGKAGQRKPLPGSRSDGGMAPMAPMAGTVQGLTQQILQREADLLDRLTHAGQQLDDSRHEVERLQGEMSQLESQLAAETAKREHFEGMLRKIAELVVNGAKGQP